jgi:D-xylose transport system substrate-binding protein
LIACDYLPKKKVGMKTSAVSVVAWVWLAALLVPPASSLAMPAEIMPPPLEFTVAVALPGGRDFWHQCRQAMLREAEHSNLALSIAFGDDNQMKQNAQVARLLAASPDVLILAAHDALGAAAAVKRARSAKVKVMALDHLALNADLDLYLAFDHERAGERQAEYLTNLAPRGSYVVLSGPPNDYSAYLSLKGAMKVLGPLIESGRIKVLADGPVIGGRAESARDLVSRLLARKLRPTAILAPDDTTAGGVVAALAAAGLAGQIPVAGSNGEPAAVRHIRSGGLALTLVKDPNLLASQALALAVRLARDENIANAGTSIYNGLKNVPAVLLPATPVDRRNLEAALKEGILTDIRHPEAGTKIH